MKSLPVQDSASSATSSRWPFSLSGVRWRDVAWHALLVALVLLGIGLAFVHAMALADESAQIQFSGHLKKLIVASPCLLMGLLLKPRWVRKNSYWLYGACLVLLLLVPIIGDERNNARRWIETPVFDLQPSEFIKLGLILALARTLHRNRLKRVRDWAKPVLLALVPMGLVVLQPDLGTALTIVPVTLGLLYLAGARGRILLGFACAAAVVAVLAVTLRIGVRDYQLERIETWAENMDPVSLIDGRRGPAFHAYHARLAIGNGGLYGKGLGQGIANEAGILPERESDSVFAVVAEEGGFFGAGGVLALYFLLVLILMNSAAGLRDRFARLVVGGVALYFAAHVCIHASVNLGLLPMTGLTLPLISTGGSSLLTTFAALGIALGLASSRERSLDQDAFRSY